MILHLYAKVHKVSEYDQEIPHSHIADGTMMMSHRMLTVSRHQEYN